MVVLLLSLRWGGVRFFRIAGTCLIMLLGLLSLWVLWSARVCLLAWFSVLWPAAWVACSDKSRSFKSVEVRRIWEVKDESLSLVHPAFWEGFRSSLLAGDVSSAWINWSFSAEVTLVRAFVGSGGPWGCPV